MARDVHRGQDVVGTVTEAVYSPRFEKNIGVGMLASEVGDDEERLEVEIGGKRRSTTVSKLPFRL